jgi:hypothetical protein
LSHLIQFNEQKGIQRSILFADATRDSFAKERVGSIRPFDPEEISWKGIGAVIVSTQKGLYAYDAEIDRHGVFAKYLINGLKGEADRASMGNGDSSVVLRELVSYIQEGIFMWSLREQKKQMPYITVNQAGMEEMPLASVEISHYPDAGAKAQVTDERPEDKEGDEKALMLAEEKRKKEYLIMAGNSVIPSSLEENLSGISEEPVIHPLYLRNRAKNLSPSDVGEMLKRYHFYSTCWNSNGDFCNPEGNFENYFLDNRNGTISDRATGLMWQKAGSPETLTWVAAKGYVQKMNSVALAGYTDWRIPTIEELSSLLEASWLNGDLFIDPVFEKEQRHCWSLDANGKNNAWKANFHLGFVLDLPMNSRNSVRLVRSLR